ETAESLSVANVLTGNTVSGSGSDGIQVQGDDNLVQANRIWNNGGYGIHLCSTESAPACVAPGTGATASGNTVRANQLDGNAMGAIGDFGEANELQGPGE
ncbi:MAG: right-handed parallel beta-helix repeat-containing protein, partial [Anaerolineae bacterium]|nr:right-handed parallel beta-helix repeat-containing protein [Anaerolineae bacterium]